MHDKHFAKAEDEIAGALHEVGCSTGDLIMVHSDLGICWPRGAKTREEALGGHYRALRKAIGDSGTIMAPCFAFHYYSAGHNIGSRAAMDRCHNHNPVHDVSP